MKTIEDIKNAESALRELRSALLTSNRPKDKEKITRQLKQLDYEQETAIMNYLETNDKSYNSIIQANFDLLINDHIEFVVTREEWGLFKSHAKRLNGQVNENGFFYGHTTETDFALLNIQRGFYPLSYRGLINYLGEADFFVDKKGYNFFGGRVPQKYIGSVDTDGNINLKTTDTFWESSGNIYVNNVVADLFSGNADKRSKFLDNKSKLKQTISDFKNNLS